MSVFDKTSEYLFNVIKFSHYDSNSPEHQSAGIFQGQLVRYRHICNSMRDFKQAVTLLTLRMLSRGHPSNQLTKGWSKHLLRYPKDRNTNYSFLRRWFRRMLFWVASNKDKKDVQDLILNRPSTSPNNTVSSTLSAAAPLPSVPAVNSLPNEIASSNQNKDVTDTNTENSWSTIFNRHIIPGDGDCFFSSVNCCMKFLNPDWQHDNISLRNLALTHLKTEVYKDPHSYLSYLSNPPDTADIDPTLIDSLWDIIKAKYQSSGQYVDNDIIMATVSVLNIDIQLHGGSEVLLNIENRVPSYTIHLLYCGLQIHNNPGNHYDALIPIIYSRDNAPTVNPAENTQTSTDDDDIENNFSSQSTQISDLDNDSSSSQSNEAIIYTETLFSKYLNHNILLPHRKRILSFLNQHKSISLSKRRKMCKICFCRFRALHLHGKTRNSKILCQFLQSIREQLLPLYLSSLDDYTPTQTSDSPRN